MAIKLTAQKISQAVRDWEDNGCVIGLCTHCGAEGDKVEPDAEKYHCECCGKAAVASPLVIAGLI